MGGGGGGDEGGCSGGEVGGANGSGGDGGGDGGGGDGGRYFRGPQSSQSVPSSHWAPTASACPSWQTLLLVYFDPPSPKRLRQVLSQSIGGGGSAAGGGEGGGGLGEGSSGGRGGEGTPHTSSKSKRHPVPAVQPSASSAVVQSLAPAARQMASASAKVLSRAHGQPAFDAPHTEQPLRGDPQAGETLTSVQQRTST